MMEKFQSLLCVRRLIVVLYVWLLGETLVLMHFWRKQQQQQQPLPSSFQLQFHYGQEIVDHSGSIWVAWSELSPGKGLRFPNACGSSGDGSGSGSATKRTNPWQDQSLLEPLDDEITLLIHGGSSKLDRVRFSIERWKGIASASLYVQSAKDLSLTMKFCQDIMTKSSSKEAQIIVVHLYMEKPKMNHPDDTTIGYPHNVLRQMALDYAPTNWFLTVDADFVTPPDASRSLTNLLVQDVELRGKMKHQQYLMVLPAFEGHVEIKDTQLHSFSGRVDQALPRTKTQLSNDFLPENKTTPFHVDVFAPGHGSTNFDKWLSFTAVTTNHHTTSWYPIDYTMRYEPYVLGYKSNHLPEYWQMFRGFGYNKWTWLAEAYLSGYQFGVLTCELCFVTHIHHRRNPTMEQTNANRKIYRRWKQHMRSTYSWTSYSMDWMFSDRTELEYLEELDGPPNIPRLVEWRIWMGRLVGRIYPANTKKEYSKQYYQAGNWIGTGPLILPDDQTTTVLESGMVVSSVSGQRYYLSNATLQWATD